MTFEVGEGHVNISSRRPRCTRWVNLVNSATARVSIKSEQQFHVDALH